jgi:large subunit ribosomal protein L5
MATTKTQGTKKSEKGGEKRASMLPKDHKGAALPVPSPRLKAYYTETVRPRLAKQFNLGNPHEIPNLTKITLNVGMGEAIKQPKVLDAIVDELAVITGQKAIRTKAKKSIANYGQREGQDIGAAVTLRGARMWEFLDRFISTALPRVRDFRGLNTRSFDGRGNYSLGVKEQMIFPEVNYDLVETIHGMDLTFVTTTNRDDMAFALLRELGMPFRGDDKPIVVQG